MNGLIEITGAFTNSFAINLTTANNGLSKSNPTTVVLGQDTGAVGDPAVLTSQREIPLDTFNIILRQGIFGPSAAGAIAVIIDFNVGGVFHGFTAESINSASGTIFFRGTNDSPLCVGAIMQLECPSAGNSVGQVVAWGTNPGLAAFKQGEFGLQSSNVLAPDIVLVATASGGGGARAGYISLATNDPATTEVEMYRFILPKSALLDFPNTLAQTSSDLNVSVPGARDGDHVELGVPNVSINANSMYFAWVSANDTVTVRFCNFSAGAIDPAAGTFKVGVTRLLP